MVILSTALLITAIVLTFAILEELLESVREKREFRIGYAGIPALFWGIFYFLNQL